MSGLNNALSFNPPGKILLGSGTVSNVATTDITGKITAAYDNYELHLYEFIPAGVGSLLQMRFSTDNGSTFKSGAADYFSTYDALNADALTLSAVAGGGGGVDSYHGIVHLINMNSTNTAYHAVTSEFERYNTGAAITTFHNIVGNSTANMAAAINAVRLFTTGFNHSGKWKLYGLRN